MKTTRRADGILRTKFREIFIRDRNTRKLAIFWSQNPFKSQRFAKVMRQSLGMSVKIVRTTDDKEINYCKLNWSEL